MVKIEVRGDFLVRAEISTEIITLGRDILRWVEKVKALHSQWKGGASIYHEEIFMDQGYEKIKSANTSLKYFAERLMKGGVHPAACIADIRKMRDGYRGLLGSLKRILAILEGMEATVVKELEGDEYIRKDLAGLESLWWELQDEISNPRAHTAVRRLISYTRYSERKERTMESYVKEVADTIRAKIERIKSHIIPQITGGIVAELEREEGELVTSLAEYSKRGAYDEMLRTVNRHMVIANQLSQPYIENAIRGTMKDLTKIINLMQKIWSYIERFEEREGALLEALEKTIKELEKSGEIPSAG